MAELRTVDETTLLARAEAIRQGEGIVAYTVQVPELDPLAVLETLDEPAPRGYFENPSRQRAHAAGSPVASWSGRGPARFAEADRWLRQLHAQVSCVGEFRASSRRSPSIPATALKASTPASSCRLGRS